MAAPPFKVKSIYEYTSEHDDDLTFPIGQVITVTELEGDEWFVGEYTDVTGVKHEGLFPTNFVEKYEPEVPTRPTRPPRAKQETAQPTPVSSIPLTTEPEQAEPPGVPASSKPPPPVVDVPTAQSSAPTTATRAEPPPAPKPAPAEPAEPAPPATKKPPPPIAAKSNAFKDRIAAFNQQAAAPITPIQPGKSQQPSNFIKKPFVAPPPSKNAYVPPPKAEPVNKPYVREEDPEIREREEEDRAAAEAVGFGTEPSTVSQGGEEEDAPKPMTLKERMALLQQQQQEQAQRRADAASKKKPPQKKASESSDYAAPPADIEREDLERTSSDRTERPSSEIIREMPRVPSTRQPPPEPISPTPAVPDHEVLSDGHEADQSGAGDPSEDDDSGTLGPDRDDGDDRLTETIRPPISYREPPDVDQGRDVAEDDEEEDEVDEETRRKEELRARMARLGGGMPGMGAPFNPFGPPPTAPPRRKQAPKERELSEEAAPSSPPQVLPQMVAVPGMQRMQSPESEATQRVSQKLDEPDEEGDLEPELPPPPKRVPTMERGAPPPVPKESRPVPPPPSGVSAPRPPALESRPVPPPPPAAVMSPGPGSESDDEMSSHAKRSSAELSGVETPLPIQSGAPPVPVSRDLPSRPARSPDEKRASYLSGSEPGSATSDKRSSRVAPPIPGQASSPISSPRPPPPPPPTQAPPSRRSTMDVQDEDDDEDEQVGSDYDGDYDTDIASGAKHKDALKAGHIREASLTDNTITDDTPLSSPVPLPPQTSAPRAVPPPPPQFAPPKTRQSMDRPPPPVPTSREIPVEDDHDYDPYRYPESSRPLPPVPNVVPAVAPPMPPPRQEESSADDFRAPLPPPRSSTDRAPPPPPQERVVSQPIQPPPPQSQAQARASGDIQRNTSTARRSIEQGRPSGEQDQIASDINLSPETPWWTAPQPLPPALQDRNGIDILLECEETSKSKRGGKKEITKDIYILYMDYSQTVISARYDSQEPTEAQLEQRHEPPPPRLRQDQLEAAWQRFGRVIAEAASPLGHSKKDSVVGDGSPQNLPLELIKSLPNALLPVGNRAYGALVYANLANASTMQYDEIRRGDIITVRNARFEGHHGAMKTKYKSDYGSSHVAIVEEWDGTRRAVRAWEQGRDRKGGVRSEKFRLGDLRSGEVRVWRVVGRDWVGWES